MTLTQTTQRIIKIIKNKEIKISKLYDLTIRNILKKVYKVDCTQWLVVATSEEAILYFIYLLESGQAGTLKDEIKKVSKIGATASTEGITDRVVRRPIYKQVYSDWFENQFAGYNEYQRLLPELTKANEQIKAETFGQKSTSSKSKDNNDSLSQLLKDTVVKVNELSTNVSGLNTKVEVLTDELAKKKEIITSLKSDNKDLKRQIAELEEALTEAKTEAAILRTTSRDLRKDGIIHLHTL